MAGVASGVGYQFRVHRHKRVSQPRQIPKFLVLMVVPNVPSGSRQKEGPEQGFVPQNPAI